MPFPFKTERQCADCLLVKVTQHRWDEHGREHGRHTFWTEWYRGLDKIESKNTPACEVLFIEEGEQADSAEMELAKCS